MNKDNTTLKGKIRWWYKPDNVWFNNRKDVKDYLGGTGKFNRSIKNRDVISIVSY